jgi:outer membrane protein assembly factor BamA
VLNNLLKKLSFLSVLILMGSIELTPSYVMAASVKKLKQKTSQNKNEIAASAVKFIIESIDVVGLKKIEKEAVLAKLALF